MELGRAALGHAVGVTQNLRTGEAVQSAIDVKLNPLKGLPEITAQMAAKNEGFKA